MKFISSKHWTYGDLGSSDMGVPGCCYTFLVPVNAFFASADIIYCLWDPWGKSALLGNRADHDWTKMIANHNALSECRQRCLYITNGLRLRLTWISTRCDAQGSHWQGDYSHLAGSVVANMSSMITSSNGNIFRVTCAWNSPVTGEFLAQRPVTRSFDVFFNLRPNKRLSKQSRGWWFETPLRPLWRHYNA